MQGAESEGLAARRRTSGYVEDVRPEVQAHGAKFARLGGRAGQTVELKEKARISPGLIF